MSCTQVFEFQKWFMEGWEEVEEDEYPGCPSTSKTPKKVLRKSFKLFGKTDL
jgi:hypothetical protein